MVKQLGYTTENDHLFYHYLRPKSSLDIGMYGLRCDEDVRCMNILLMSFKLSEVYIEHGCTSLIITKCHQDKLWQQ